MKGIQFSTFGDATDVLDFVELDEPAPPARGEVLVGIEFSPLNFHDLFFIGGHLAPPALPAVPGNEGIGTVLQAGPGVTDVGVGDRVVLPLLTGAWRQRVTIPAAGLFALPDKHVEQLAMLGSNVPAAGLMLSEYAQLAPGDWVIHNAANGGVGRSVIALAHQRGLRTVNVVRRFDAVDELRSAGADVVVVDHPGVLDDIRAQTRGASITLGIDSVGGAAAATVLAALSPGSALVSYGNASGTGIDAEAAEAKNVTVSNTFVGAFDYLDEVVPVIKEAVPLIDSGALTVPIEAIYELDDIKAAIEHLTRGRKILLHIS
jgi:NADPH:quinone reductase-like Zn-dependent oxidoreductase